MGYNTIKLDVQDNIALLTLNRPQKLNAMTVELVDEVVDALDYCDKTDDVRAIIVTGEGRAYCAGADLSGGAGGFTDDAGSDLINEDGSFNYASESARDAGGRITLRIYDLCKPIIGAINGAAVGGGATMTLAMDVRLASTKAKFAFPFTKRGIVPESASSFFLPRIVGITNALELCLGGDLIGAEEALRIGLVSGVYEPDDLMPNALEKANKFAKASAPVSVALSRQLLWKGLGWDHPMQAHRYESRGVLSRSVSNDAKEGVEAFMNKRVPNFPDVVSSDLPDFYPWWDDQKYQ